MGDLNVPRKEAEALKAINTTLLATLINQSIREERSSAHRNLRLDFCGPFVTTRLRVFEKAISAHAAAKSPKKRTETDYNVRRAGRDLEYAVQQMKDRVAIEEKGGQLFFIDDDVMPPINFSEELSVLVNYRWRESTEADWKHRNTRFSFTSVSRPNYISPKPARKLSAARQERDRQDTLYWQWEHLKMLGLQAIRDHFRQGGTGDTIPEVVRAKTDTYTKGLNNFSARF